jgi:mono/diheme cytochrome c family protein
MSASALLGMVAALSLGGSLRAPLCRPATSTPEAAARGRQLFTVKACFACHRLDGRALVGPPLDGVSGTQVMLATGAMVCADAAYLTQSIDDPEAALVAGFDQQMPPMELSPSEISDLVAFIASVPAHAPHPELGMSSPFVARGRQIFEKGGCASCHGAGGVEPVPNPGATDEHVPQLNRLADRMLIGGPVEAKAAVELLGRKSPPNTVSGRKTPEGYGQFLAQYRAVHNKIAFGSKPAEAYPGVMRAPLEMPAWHSVLSTRDIDAVIAYLITLQDWKE